MMEKRLKLTARKKRREMNLDKFIGTAGQDEISSIPEKDSAPSSKRLEKYEDNLLFETEAGLSKGRAESHDLSREDNPIEEGLLLQYKRPSAKNAELSRQEIFDQEAIIPRVEEDSLVAAMAGGAEADSTNKFKQQLDQLFTPLRSDEPNSVMRATSNSATANVTTSQGFCEHQREKKLRRAEMRRCAAVSRCLFFRSLQRRRLAEKALRIWHILLILPSPSIVLYATVDSSEELIIKTDLNSMKKRSLARGIYASHIRCSNKKTPMPSSAKSGKPAPQTAGVLPVRQMHRHEPLQHRAHHRDR